MKIPAPLPLSVLALVLTAHAIPAWPQGGADPSTDAQRLGSPMALPDGATVESMWPAPTAADWERPCRLHFERTFDDALRVSAETRKPLLVCVNMDGEPASEHWAGLRYRGEETARLLAPYVLVVASVYRHTPRDHDVDGRRILCPRFGSVTCGEHIAIEPVLYDKYFEGKRVAPRHILLERDGSEGYDVYFSWDTASVVRAFVEGAKDRPEPIELRGDRPLAARVASAAGEDRAALELAYLTGTRATRRELLESTLRTREVDQIELLRLALFGLDVELARLARLALAQAESEAALDLIAEALKVPMAAEERARLLAAAERLAERFPRGRTLVAVQQGLASASRWVDVAGWTSGAAAEYDAAARAASEIDARARAAETRPADGPARLAFAESLLARAEDPALEPNFVHFLQMDAHAAALEAEALGVRGWRVDAVLAATHAARGEREPAIARALAAVEGGMPRPGSGDALDEGNAVRVLALFAQARQRAIAAAYRERKPWPPEWLADVHAAYAVLVQHPLGTDVHVADGFDFLSWLGATTRAQETLEHGLTRFPESWLLHERLRGQLLRERGPAGLEEAYAARLAAPDAPPSLAWFAAYASIVAAESQRRTGEREAALAAYARALAGYERDRAEHPEHAESVDHYAAIALAGRGHVLFERGELEPAARALLTSFARSPDAAAAFDGLGLTAIDSARALLARLETEGETALFAELQSGLEVLGQERLDRPDLQRGVPNEAARAGDRRQRSGG
jgi:tetratricopeptide (TPR) repeat protein